ncbi:MAG: tRNA(Met) cytidine acetyltransferase [Idiomarina sp.]|nr:tRNA(Met) cytidine acetyltransferase [Idiomarina sp.]
MSVPQHPQSEVILTELQQLASQAASTQWRGLMVIKAEQQVRFEWPSSALVLANNLADYREYLGITSALLVLDMRETLHGDALAAMLPTIRAQGLAILLLPVQDSAFSRRLLHHLPPLLSTYVELQPCPNGAACLIDLRTNTLSLLGTEAPTPHYNRASLTPEQAGVFSRLMRHVQQQVPAPVLIKAPRGRGKSTLLGVLAKALSQQGCPVWLCAPSRRQAATLLNAAGSNQQIQYIAPDVLLADEHKAVDGCLIVDEAASLPRHMLNTLIDRYPQVIMATTSEGYETCGRGFLLQFQAQLQTDFADCLTLQLNQPIRFAPNCPVEGWLHHALLLSALEPLIKPRTQVLQHRPLVLEYSVQHASSLTEDVLSSCFQLLMDAHYQTSPNDLKLLLNDESQSLCLQWATPAGSDERTLVGVIWLSEEGGLEQTLADAVVAGSRRPPGNLLAQSLARHLQNPAVACVRWLRVVRIAVRDDCQRQGLGSDLLQHVISLYTHTEAYPQVAGIGTSFASATQINRFWGRHDFQPIKIGSRRDSATARHSLLMLLPLQNEWVQPIASWAQYFRCEVAACQQLYGLSDDYVMSLYEHAEAATLPGAEHPSAKPGYAQWAEHRINAFACGQLDLDSVRATLLTRFPDQVEADPILSAAVHSARLSRPDKHRLQLAGRKALIQQAREVCLQLLAKI